jgi:hypothetical protein
MHETQLLPPDGFLRNFIFYTFTDICCNIRVLIQNRTKITDPLRQYLLTFMISPNRLVFTIKTGLGSVWRKHWGRRNSWASTAIDCKSRSRDIDGKHAAYDISIIIDCRCVAKIWESPKVCVTALSTNQTCGNNTGANSHTSYALRTFPNLMFFIPCTVPNQVTR